MEHRINWRGSHEYYVENEHLRLEDLQAAAETFNEENEEHRIREEHDIFLERSRLPEYPRPEFHVSHLKHDTDKKGLTEIKESGGFRDPGHHKGTDFLQWWSLAVKPQAIKSAERRLLEKTYPDQTPAEAQDQRRFLRKFASSPAFLKTSRLGSYRFTFSVEEVLKAYSKKFCKEAPPVMRVYKTVLYKQEVMYVVVVHGPDVKKYDNYTDLSEVGPEAVCCYEEGKFIWRSQAMCGKLKYELVQIPEENRMDYQERNGFPKYYVWDHVAIALHMEEDWVLELDDVEKNLKHCDEGDISYPGVKFEDLDEARRVVKRLWPDAPLLE